MKARMYRLAGVLVTVAMAVEAVGAGRKFV